MFESASSLKERIKEHYDQCSEHVYKLYEDCVGGQSIHHGYWLTGQESKEEAQENLMTFMLQQGQLKEGSRVLDVGCGLGGTGRFLVEHHHCKVFGITLSDEQVRMAKQLSANIPSETLDFVRLDAETLVQAKSSIPFLNTPVDAVWICEAMSHMPNKDAVFDGINAMLKSGGHLIIADWFKSEKLDTKEALETIAHIERGMLLPPLCTVQDYVQFATTQGFEIISEPRNISKDVAKTWDISLSLVSSPALWRLAFAKGWDVVEFLRSFQAMRTGYASGSFQYHVMAFKKP